MAGILSCPFLVRSQPRKRSVRGKVTDRSGLLLKGAAVRLKDTGSLRIRSYIVQGDGLYHIANLRTDVDYELKATFLDATSDSKRLDRFDSREEAVIDFVVDISNR
ncbi:MAG: carboxypeptidase regulatory-like domain-containing protein [Bryobacterales bacterium]|nr:carboxypeptidase regulatory-like domain-containing protein [Bryobacterales bacterium]